MNPNKDDLEKARVVIDISDIDIAIEKTKRLCEVLKEAKSLLKELTGSGDIVTDIRINRNPALDVHNSFFNVSKYRCENYIPRADKIDGEVETCMNCRNNRCNLRARR